MNSDKAWVSLRWTQIGSAKGILLHRDYHYPIDSYSYYTHNREMRIFIPIFLFIPTLVAQGTTFTCFKGPELPEVKEQRCLATMIYGEARGEGFAGKVAVAYTAMNRAVNRTVCDVILAPKQYSIFNDNPALRNAATRADVEPTQKNEIDFRNWMQSQKVAEIVYQKKIKDPTNGSTHYLAPAVMAAKGYTYPKWSIVYTKTTVIDNHHFFKKDKRV